MWGSKVRNDLFCHFGGFSVLLLDNFIAQEFALMYSLIHKKIASSYLQTSQDFSIVNDSSIGSLIQQLFTSDPIVLVQLVICEAKKK